MHSILVSLLKHISRTSHKYAPLSDSAHAQKPELVFLRNGRVRLNRPGGVQFSRLLAVEECGSAGKTTGYPLHSHLSPSLPLPCVTVCRLIPIQLYCRSLFHLRAVQRPLSLARWLDSSNERSADHERVTTDRDVIGEEAVNVPFAIFCSIFKFHNYTSTHIFRFWFLLSTLAKVYEKILTF